MLERIQMHRASILLCSALLVGSLAARAETNGAASVDNWTNHPDVKEVRGIYEEVRRGIKDKTYKVRVRRFNVKSPLCSTYPVKSETLVVDGENRPRLYQLEQMGSHREQFSVERYYDARGVLRFVYVDRVTSSIRIYLDRRGKVVWAIEKSGERFAKFDANNDDWETKPGTANGARAAFQSVHSCPEMGSE